MAGSPGIRLVEVPAGRFLMGQAPSDGGDWDESPIHEVTLSRPFRVGATEVTNAQYERFDPAHAALRGKRGFCAADDEPVTFVSWHDAVAFCEWLTRMEGVPYRLPTEAEWEYACRAGTSTPYHTGQALPEEHWRHQEFGWDPTPVDLRVGVTPPNAWGLHEMHGGVEEWCLDWYGPYDGGPWTDPVGPAEGTCRVARGGSHNTPVQHLRSANRLAALPEDRHWLLGFRVVQAPPPEGQPTPAAPPARWAVDVAPTRQPGPQRPTYNGAATPLPYVLIPEGANGPLYSHHNHCPAVTWCPNGNLLADWFTTNTERGRELTIAASRLRAGTANWEPAAPFLQVPDRNLTGTALLTTADGAVHHFNGVEAGDGWANLAVAMRSSRDNGATWSPPRLIVPEHQRRNQVIAGAWVSREGWWVLACDAVYSGQGGTAIHVSRDEGVTWQDPGANTPPPAFAEGTQGGTIAGIHAAVVQLGDGSLLAYGRGNNQVDADGELWMTASRSRDFGRTWTYERTGWPPITGGQRLVLLRLQEGPLLFASFTDASKRFDAPVGMDLTGPDGVVRRGYGLFAALSYDDGATWPHRRLVSDGVPRRMAKNTWADDIVTDMTHAEPNGYLAAVQAPGGEIHLVSSRWHYPLTLAWLRGGD